MQWLIYSFVTCCLLTVMVMTSDIQRSDFDRVSTGKVRISSDFFFGLIFCAIFIDCKYVGMVSSFCCLCIKNS